MKLPCCMISCDTYPLNEFMKNSANLWRIRLGAVIKRNEFKVWIKTRIQKKDEKRTLFWNSRQFNFNDADWLLRFPASKQIQHYSNWQNFSVKIFLTKNRNKTIEETNFEDIFSSVLCYHGSRLDWISSGKRYDSHRASIFSSQIVPIAMWRWTL